MKRWAPRVALATVLLTGLLAFAAHVELDLPRDLEPSERGALVVVDRRGQPLRSVASSRQPLRAQWVSLSQVSSVAVLTLLAGEDQSFFSHSGVDGWSVLRALWLDLKALSPRYGASTLTMQLARMLYPEQIGHDALGKLRQLPVAWALERALSKRQILEQYLNRAYFGHGAYGIESAAQTYFQRPAASLSEAQATLLMVLPRGPATYDLARHGERARARQKHLLGLLVKQQRLSAENVARIVGEPVQIALRPPRFEAGHIVDWALSNLPVSER
ncbi:MAG TPA: biosynthetic peptidoglycan transglycosylase, partial [Polyangiales bacterium]